MKITGIIDPPVNSFSTIEKIRAWIQELENMPPSEERDICLSEAREWEQGHPDAKRSS